MQADRILDFSRTRLSIAQPSQELFDAEVFQNPTSLQAARRAKNEEAREMPKHAPVGRREMHVQRHGDVRRGWRHIRRRVVRLAIGQELIDSGLQAEAYRGLNQRPWAEGHCTLDDLVKANRYLTLLFARRQTDARGEEQNDREVFFPAEVFDEFQRLVKTLVREDRIFISDRKLVKLYKLFRVRAWLFSGGTVSRDDLRLLAYLGETHQEIELLRAKVPDLLGEA